jgi:deoxyribodipyrimidine photolyase
LLAQGLPSFEHDRAKTDRESTTMLSPWIHFGSISVRHIYYRVAQKHAEWQASGVDKGRSCLDFLQQMGYREYSRWGLVTAALVVFCGCIASGRHDFVCTVPDHDQR